MTQRRLRLIILIAAASAAANPLVAGWLDASRPAVFAPEQER